MAWEEKNDCIINANCKHRIFAFQFSFSTKEIVDIEFYICICMQCNVLMIFWFIFSHSHLSAFSLRAFFSLPLNFVLNIDTIRNETMFHLSLLFSFEMEIVAALFWVNMNECSKQKRHPHYNFIYFSFSTNILHKHFHTPY